MKTPIGFFKKLASLGMTGLLLASCAHQPSQSSEAARENAGIVLAGEPNEVNVVFFASSKCFTQPFGCGLGGQLGGSDAQLRLLKEKAMRAATLGFWGGTTFRCDGK